MYVIDHRISLLYFGRSPPAVTGLIDGHGQRAGGGYVDAYGRLLANLAISSITTIAAPHAVEEIRRGVQPGSKVSLVGFLLLVLLDFLLVCVRARTKLILSD